MIIFTMDVLVNLNNNHRDCLNLDRAGFRLVDRHEIVKEKSVEELNAQLVSLVGENGAQLLVGAFRSRRSISGPELAG